MESHFDEHKSNYTFISFAQKCFSDPTMRFCSQVQNLRALTKAQSLPQPHVCPQSSTTLLCSITSYKDYNQTWTTTQHSAAHSKMDTLSWLMQYLHVVIW